MKKIYLILTILMFTYQVNGQVNKARGVDAAIHGSPAIKFSVPPPTTTSNLAADEVVIWGDNPGEGDFDGGLNGWTLEPVSDTIELWYWDADATINGSFSDQITLASETAANGVMVFNADYLTTAGNPDNLPEQPYPIHIGDLISPTIDMTDAIDPQVRFTQAFRGLTGDDNLTVRGALFAYSSDDGATWTDFEPINDNLDLREYSDNPAYKRIEMPGTAGSATVKIKFRFSGNFYFWMIDDVKIVERPAHNLAISEFGVSVAEYFISPTTQLYPVYFGGYVSNIGGEDQSNVTLSAKVDAYDLFGNLVTDDVFSNSTSIEVLESGKSDSLMLFATADNFVPTGEGNYQIEYQLSQDSTDADPSNNSSEISSFFIYDGYYSKAILDLELQPLRTAAYRPTDVTSYEYGVHMYIPNGSLIDAQSIQFSYASNGSLAGVDITIILREWNDANADALITDDELKIVGFNTHSYTTETNYDVVTVALLDADTNQEGVRLKDDTHYILTGQYDGQADVFMAVDESIEYDPSVNASIERVAETGDANLIRFADVLYTNGEWGIRGFNIVGVPSLSMITTMATAIEDAEGVPVEVSMHPNPVNDILHVDVATDLVSNDWQVSISDVSGRTVLLNRTAQQTDFPLQINTNQFANGIYILTLENNGQIHTERFVKR